MLSKKYRPTKWEELFKSGFTSLGKKTPVSPTNQKQMLDLITKIGILKTQVDKLKAEGTSRKLTTAGQQQAGKLADKITKLQELIKAQKKQRTAETEKMLKKQQVKNLVHQMLKSRGIVPPPPPTQKSQIIPPPPPSKPQPPPPPQKKSPTTPPPPPGSPLSRPPIMSANLLKSITQQPPKSLPPFQLWDQNKMQQQLGKIQKQKFRTGEITIQKINKVFEQIQKDIKQKNFKASSTRALQSEINKRLRTSLKPASEGTGLLSPNNKVLTMAITERRARIEGDDEDDDEDGEWDDDNIPSVTTKTTTYNRVT